MTRRCQFQLFRILWTPLAALAILSSVSFGNVYPTSLGQSGNTLNTGAAETLTLSYLLNDNATDVTVSILNGTSSVVRTMSQGAQGLGVQTVSWDGKDNGNNFLPNGAYSFRVTSSGDPRGDWTLITTDGTLNDFELPRGVGVNRNPNSPYYGRVYVSNGRSDPTAAAREMSDGMYMLNADLSDTGIVGGTGPHTAGVSWQTATDTPSDGFGVSPFRLQVGADDGVYITDWSDSHAALWQATPNLSSAVEVLDSTGRNEDSGLNATHGSISDVVIVGTGASRQIYTSDEDFVPPGGSSGSVLRYDIGTTATFTGAPSGYAYTDGPSSPINKIINFENSIALDNNGKLWLSQNRFGSSTDTSPSLMQIDPATGGVLWASVPNLAANTLADPLRGIGGIAYDPLNNLLALVTRGQSSTRSGLIMIFDPVSKTILQQFQFGGRDNNDVAFDNAGNLYVTNQITEKLRIWSPPNGTVYADNLFSTNSLGALGSITLSGGVGQLGDYNLDNKVEALDYVLWRKGDINGATGYTNWRNNFGAGTGVGSNLGGAAAVPEPGTVALVLMALLLPGIGRRRR